MRSSRRLFLATALPFAVRAFASDSGIQSDLPIGIRFFNNNSSPQHISGDWAFADTARFPNLVWPYEIVQPGQSTFMPAPAETSPKYFLGPTPNNRTPEVGSKRDHDTIVEVTFKGFSDFTFFDIDIEKGFSVPVWCHGEKDEWNAGHGCTADVLAQCPDVSKHYDNATGIYDQCLASEADNNFYMRTQLCPDVYVKPDDDKTRVPNNSSHVVICTIMDTATDRQRANHRSSQVHSGGHAQFRARQLS